MGGSGKCRKKVRYIERIAEQIACFFSGDLNSPQKKDVDERFPP